MLKTKLIAASCVTLALLASQGAWATGGVTGGSANYTFTANAPVQTAVNKKKVYFCVQLGSGSTATYAWALAPKGNEKNSFTPPQGTALVNVTTSSSATPTASANPCQLGANGTLTYTTDNTGKPLSNAFKTGATAEWSTGVAQTNG